MEKSHNEELHIFYSSPNISNQNKSGIMGWVGHVARMGGEKMYKVLVGKPKGKRPLGRPRRTARRSGVGYCKECVTQ
jgi:hypothetical protein